MLLQACAVFSTPGQMISICILLATLWSGDRWCCQDSEGAELHHMNQTQLPTGEEMQKCLPSLTASYVTNINGNEAFNI